MAVESLGQAYVEILPNTKGFSKTLEGELDDAVQPAADKASKTISDGLGGALKKIGGLVAAAGVGAFFKSAVDAAGDLNEQTSKVGVVFEGASKEVLAFGDRATKSMGASKVEALAAAGTFGNLLRSTGVAADKAADMSVQMVQLAGDMASFNNVPTAETLQAIQSGLAGETEPLKRFGVNLNEAALKAEAMALGLDASGPVLDANTKAQAAYSLILKQTSLAQGDFARTSDSLANQQRILSAEFANAKAEAGQALLPAMLNLVKAGRDLIPVVVTVASAVGDLASAVSIVLRPLGALASTDAGQTLITVGLAAGGAYYAFTKLAPVIESVGKLAAKGAEFFAEAATDIASAGTDALEAGASFASAGADATEAGASFAAAGADAAETGASLASAGGDAIEAGASLAAAGANAVEGASGFAGAAGNAGLLSGALGGVSSAAGAAIPIAAGLIPVAAGVAAAFVDWRKKTKELDEQHQEWEARLLSGGDKAARLADDYKKLGDQLRDTKEATVTSTQASSEADQVQQELDANLQKYRSTLASTGLGWDQAKAAILGTRKEFDAFLEPLRKIDPATGTVNQQLYELSGALETVRGNTEHARSEQDKAVKTTIDLAVKQGLLTQAQVDQAKATAISTDAHTQWIAAGEALQPVLDKAVVAKAASAEASKREAAAQDEAIQSAVGLIDPTKRLELVNKELEEATKAVKTATDDAKAAQDAWLFGAVDYQSELDDTTKAVRDMKDVTKDLTEEQFQNAISGADNSEASIKVRDAYKQVTHEAAGAVEAIGKNSATAEEATARTQAYAQQQYELAIAYGYPESEAAKVRDTILQIPQTHNSNIDVQQHGAEVAKAEIDSAARDRQTEIAVSFYVQNKAVIDSIRQQMGLPALAAAHGAVVPHRPGGTLALVGEGRHDEAIVPLTQSMLGALADFKRGARVPSGQPGLVLNVTISGQLDGGDANARRLGRIVGESAARVLTQRQLATSMRTA